jgi:hypothetical protein
MAKLDWEKLNRKSKVQSANEKCFVNNLTKEHVRKEGLWMQKGKYFEKNISTLPLDYLEWIIDNPKLRTHFKKQAQEELRRRYQNLSNT